MKTARYPHFCTRSSGVMPAAKNARFGTRADTSAEIYATIIAFTSEQGVQHEPSSSVRYRRGHRDATGCRHHFQTHFHHDGCGTGGGFPSRCRGEKGGAAREEANECHHERIAGEVRRTRDDDAAAAGNRALLHSPIATSGTAGRSSRCARAHGSRECCEGKAERAATAENHAAGGGPIRGRRRGCRP